MEKAMLIDIMYVFNIFLTSMHFTNLTLLIKYQHASVLKSDFCTIFKLFNSQKYVLECNSNVVTKFECEFKWLLQRLNSI